MSISVDMKVDSYNYDKNYVNLAFYVSFPRVTGSSSNLWVTVNGDDATNGGQSIDVGVSTAVVGYKLYGNTDGSMPSITVKATIGGESTQKVFTVQSISRSGTIKTVSDVYIGDKCDVYLNLLDMTGGADVHYILEFSIGTWTGQSGKIYDYDCDNGRYNKYTIPLEAANQLPDRTSGVMLVTLITYSEKSGEEGKQIGAPSTSSFRVTVPDSMKPKLSTVGYWPVYSAANVSSEIISGVMEELNTSSHRSTGLSGFSRVILNMVGEGSYGSYIERYKITGAYSKVLFKKDLNQDRSAMYRGDIIHASSDVSFTIICTDSRGRESSPWTVSVPFIKYYPPKITRFSAANSGGYVQLYAQWTSNEDGGNLIASQNECTAIVKYKKSSPNGDSMNDVWVNLGQIQNGIALKTDKLLDQYSTYVFRLVVSDKLLVSDEQDEYITARPVLIDLKRGGLGLGIGKVCEGDRLEVAMNAAFYKSVMIGEKTLSEYIQDSAVVLDESAYGTADERPINPKVGQVYFQKVT